MAPLTPAHLPEIRANPRFLLRELMDRGITVHAYDIERELFVLEHRGVQKKLLGIEHEGLPWISRELIDDKMLTKKVLREGGLSFPPGRRFAFSQLDPALIYARSLGFPVVVKPFNGGRGENVHIGLDSMRAVEGAAEALCQRRADAYFLLEKQVRGEELRIFVTKKGRYAAVQRTPAALVGDGASTVAALAKRETERRMSPRVNCLGPIELDAQTDRWLSRQGLSRTSVPAAGQRVEVHGHVEGFGAYVVDASERIHPSLAVLCKQALELFPGVDYFGVDLISTCPTEPQSPGTYWILEVNNNPGIGMHLAPAEGKGRNVAAEIADHLFPETETTNLELSPCLQL